MSKTKTLPRQRNNAKYDVWSINHVISGAVAGWLMQPVIAMLLLAAYEPIEVLVMCPLLAKINIKFGYEGLTNSTFDIIFDFIGLMFGYLVLRHLATPPYHWFYK